jgi:hypothetical protein
MKSIFPKTTPLRLAILLLCISFSGCFCNQPRPISESLYPTPTPVPKPVPTAVPAFFNILAPQPGQSFISTDTINLNAELKGGTASDIAWSMYGYPVTGQDERNYYYNPDSQLDMQMLMKSTGTFFPRLVLIADGRGYKLIYILYISGLSGGINIYDSIYIVQNSIDQCRQEYIDISRPNSYHSDSAGNITTVPPGSDFSSEIYTVHFSHDELKISSDYNEIIITSELGTGIENVRNALNTYMIVNSCYRNPRHNEELANSALNSLHIYGRAVDIAIDHDFDGDGKTIPELEWNYVYNIAVANDASVESSVLTGYNYIHMQW